VFTSIVSAVGLLVVTNIAASIYVARAPRYERSQTIAQIILIWVLPIIGAVICIVFLYQDRNALRRETGDASSLTDSNASAIHKTWGHGS